MEKLVVIGPYTDSMKKALARHLPDGIQMEYITSYEEYEKLSDADYLILRTLRLDQQHVEGLAKARLIQRWGAGYDTVDLEAAGKKNIPVAVAAGVNARSVAELTLVFMLALRRNLIPQAEAFRRGENRRTELAASSRCICGETVGILGMGSIGRLVAELTKALGAHVLYYDVMRMEEEKEKELGYRYGSLDEVLSEADIVTLHLPLLESTKGLIGKEALNRMKEGAVLINAARQELVQEEELAQALKEGRLSGAGLDEIAEPFAQSPFVGLDNVICTPHIGGSTVDIDDAMAQVCMEHIETIRAGKKLAPPSLVNGSSLTL